MQPLPVPSRWAVVLLLILNLGQAIRGDQVHPQEAASTSKSVSSRHSAGFRRSLRSVAEDVPPVSLDALTQAHQLLATVLASQPVPDVLEILPNFTNKSPALDDGITPDAAPKPQPTPQPTLVYSKLPTISVYFHVVKGYNEQGELIAASKISRHMCEAQVRVLNKYYNDFGFNFELKDVDYTSTFYEEYYYTEEEEQGLVKPSPGLDAHALQARKRTPYKATDLHVYVNKLDRLGFTMKWPWNLGLAEVQYQDGIAIDHDCVAGNDNAPKRGSRRGGCRYHDGEVLVHEVGHWLGLLHPWSPGSCDNPTQDSSDFVFDTPPQLQPIGPSCSDSAAREAMCEELPSAKLPDPNNIMQQTNSRAYCDKDKARRARFTPGQVERARSIYWGMRVHHDAAFKKDTLAERYKYPGRVGGPCKHADGRQGICLGRSLCKRRQGKFFTKAEDLEQECSASAFGIACCVYKTCGQGSGVCVTREECSARPGALVLKSGAQGCPKGLGVCCKFLQ